MPSRSLSIAIVAIFLVGVVLFLTRGEQFELPRGETVPLETAPSDEDMTEADGEEAGTGAASGDDAASRVEPHDATLEAGRAASTRQVLITDGVKHSIPLNEILSGGPPKDGIPSIDNPQFVSASEATFLNNDDIGLGLVHNGEARFYPYQVLVWHEIVNDTVQGDPLLVTYCPLCLTGIVFDRRLDGTAVEFGVSGQLWRSNLLMYNRAADTDQESLWSQVLGEAVLGPHTGERLAIVPSDTVRYGDWRRAHPDTAVLSRNTGAVRPYGSDPYGDYYTSDEVSFGASFSDTRLHPKTFVLGIEIGGQYKAYSSEDLPIGTTVDQFAGETITIEKSDIGEVRMFRLPARGAQAGGPDRTPLSYIGGFWFSWLAVHPDTALHNE